MCTSPIHVVHVHACHISVHVQCIYTTLLLNKSVPLRFECPPTSLLSPFSPFPSPPLPPLLSLFPLPPSLFFHPFLSLSLLSFPSSRYISLPSPSGMVCCVKLSCLLGIWWMQWLRNSGRWFEALSVTKPCTSKVHYSYKFKFPFSRNTNYKCTEFIFSSHIP